MNIVRALAASGLAALSSIALGCVSPDVADIRVETEVNPKINFAGYKTYAWAAAAAVVRDPEREWTPPDLDVGAEIKFLVDRELRKRNLSEASGEPDVLVVYAVGVDMESLSTW